MPKVGRIGDRIGAFVRIDARHMPPVLLAPGQFAAALLS
jgi:hypothetical protein